MQKPAINLTDSYFLQLKKSKTKNNWILCKVIKFEALQVDKQYKGPVVIENNNTTVVVGLDGFYKKNWQQFVIYVLKFPIFLYL